MQVERLRLAYKSMAKDEEDASERPRSSLSSQQILQVLAAVFYGVCAVSMNFVNKGAILQFPLTNVLLLNQMVLALLFITSAKRLRLVEFRDLTLPRAYMVLPVSVLYVANVAFSLMSLSSLNVVFYSTMKRLTPMIVLIIKAVMTRQLPPRSIILSVGLVVGGCVVAGLGDFGFELKGYAFALTSCLLQAGYLLLVEYNGEAKSVSSMELMVYNAVWSIPALIAVVFLTGEADKLPSALASGKEKLGSVLFTLMLLGCGTFGMMLNLSQFLCTMLNSALTTTIVGVLKGVAATGLGFVFFGGVQTGFLNLSGIVMNTAGGVWYSVAKYRQKAVKTTK